MKVVTGLLLCLTASMAWGDDTGFGDDDSPYALDGVCNDPQFVGSGMTGPTPVGVFMHDATDCTAAFAAGVVNRTEQSVKNALGDSIFADCQRRPNCDMW